MSMDHYNIFLNSLLTGPKVELMKLAAPKNIDTDGKRTKNMLESNVPIKGREQIQVQEE